jgi:hypothetical protein
MVDPITNFTSKTFAEQLHTNFMVQLGDGNSVTLKLSAVNEPPTPPGIELFSLLFQGPREPRLTQQIRRFEHEKLGAFDLFMTAVGADEESTSYEVIFHRLHKTQL